ncbi:hypothetical protein BCV70DRAFT_165537 [Testicularia cyperi]|uniref:Zn(2)-C6 fungal-type domain-containing protein n=1 Tax=Testicularia cyperi TaxID=1882483 RepID=A0A317XIK4_9BASI|nr:hypothetical protein BCV70DRAFT_165537 [Testicularia cyperi]
MALTPGSFHPHNGIGSSGVGSSDSELLGENAGGLQPTLQPQRKRLRISRACDECRRRKTRCDIVGAFPGEPGHPLTISGAVPPLEPNTEPKGDMLILQPCMNCRRSEVTCSYSKRPLKRGPSKGYIKDLERRLNSLESQMVQGERTDDRESQQQTPLPEAEPDTGANAAAATPRLKVRTEDRISRLESVLARPRHATRDETAIKSEASSPETATATAATLTDLDVLRSESVPVSQRSSDPVAAPTAAPASVSPTTVPASLTRSDKILLADADIADSVSDALRKPARVADEAKAKSEPAPVTSAAGVVDVAELKDKLFATYLHATFPILPFRTEDEGGQRARSVAALEDRVLARGMRLLMDPVDMTGMPRSVEAEVAHDADHSRSGTPAASVASAASSGSKAKTHAVKVAQLVGQASAGLGNSRDELALQARSDVERLRALRKIAQRLSGQEADLLMLCHLDHLRNGQSNNSALAAAVSKLGSGACAQNDRETYRRRTMLFMLDRWHAVAFGTPHLLQGRFGMERNSFRSMKDALAPLSPTSPLGDGVYEVLRAAVMLGQLDDLAQNNGGWKSVSLTDVEAVIHSATDANERDTVVQSVRRANEGEEEAVPDLLSSAALRYSLESTVRCYHALRTLPIGKDAKVEDVQRVFGLAERIVVLGTVKAPISLQGKLIQSAIGPQVLAIAGVAFSWCLRIICRLVSKSLASEPKTSTSTSTPASSTKTSVECLPLEHYRRKIQDYVRMCGPFCMFSGGIPTDPGSFKGVYLRLALYFNQTVGFASAMGSLVTDLPPQSPAKEDPTALASDADSVAECLADLGCLGYVLASTNPRESWRLLAF